MDEEWDALVKPRTWLTELQKSLNNSVKRGDSINVWGMPLIGTSTQIRKLSSSKNDSKIAFAHVDTQWLSSSTPDSFYELLNTHLSDIHDTTDDISSFSPLLQTQRLLTNITKQFHICIIIDTIEHLAGLDKNFYLSIKALRDKFFGKLCFIFVSSRPLYDHPEFTDNEEFVDFACHKEIVALPLGEEETRHEVIATLGYFNISTSPKDIEQSVKNIEKIVQLTGGSSGLLKSILRVTETDPSSEIDEEQLVDEPSIKSRINRIIENFTDTEKAYLSNLARGEAPKTKASPFIKKSGLISNGKIRSLLVERTFQKYSATNKNSGVSVKDSGQSQIDHSTQKGLSFDFISGEIFRNGDRLPDILSKTEARIIKMMTDNGKILTTREDVAQVIWGDETKDNYSDWAIDKTISRIRHKIEDSKRPYKNLVTIKGRGFKLYQIPK